MVNNFGLKQRKCSEMVKHHTPCVVMKQNIFISVGMIRYSLDLDDKILTQSTELFISQQI